MAQNGLRIGLVLLGIVTLCQSGCVAPRSVAHIAPAAPPRPVATSLAGLAKPIPIKQVAHEEPAGDAAPLTLARLVTLAEQSHPDLAVARARAEAARGMLVQAGLYPNPRVSWEFGELGHNQDQLGEQGPRVQQMIVTAGKIQLDQAAAAQALVASEWQLLTRWFSVLTRIRSAFYEVLTAQRDVRTNEEVVRLAEEGLTVAQRLIKAGFGTRPDELRAQVELDQSRFRLGVARQRLESARQLLAAVTGVATLPDGTVEGDLEAEVPTFDWEPTWQSVRARSSEIMEAQALVAQAEQLVQRAIAQRHPDVMLSARPFYVFPNNDTRVSIEVGVQLPVFNRNQGNIAAAQADLTRAREQVRLIELNLTERLATAFQRYRNARLQAESFQKQILPNARESLRLVRLGYEKGDPKYDYTGVLQAQQTLVQAQLSYVQALGELWRAVSEIAGLVQQEEW